MTRTDLAALMEEWAGEGSEFFDNRCEEAMREHGAEFVHGAIAIAKGRKIEINHPRVLADVLTPEQAAERIAAVTLVERLY